MNIFKFTIEKVRLYQNFMLEKAFQKLMSLMGEPPR